MLNFTITRKLPGWRLVVEASYNAIDNDNSFGVILIPNGIAYHRLNDPLAITPFGQ